MQGIYNRSMISRARCAEEVDVNSKIVRQFIEDCEKEGFIFKNLMILRHGKVAVQCTRTPYAPTEPNAMFSFSKILTSIAIGFAIQEGLLHLNTTIEEIFQNKYSKEKLKNVEGITIEHLLTMTAGKKMSLFENKTKVNWLDSFIKPKPKAKPGEKFIYCSENSYMLGRMLAEVTGLTICEYLKPRLFFPLDIEVPFWESDKEGFNAGGWGLYLSIEDMAKITQCFLNKGMWQNVQVIPRDYIEQSITPKVFNLPNSFSDGYGFGYHCWCGRSDGYYRFEGLYSQSAFVYPNQDACVIVNSADISQQVLFKLIDRYFPLAFENNDLENPPEEEQRDFKDYLNSLTYPVLSSVQRNLATESGINKAVYKMTRLPFSTLQSMSVLLFMKERSGKIDHISFEFFDDYGYFSWEEQYVGKNTIYISFDGQKRLSTIKLADTETHIACYGSWDINNRLTLQFIPLATPDVRTFVFTFKSNFLKVKMKIWPSLYKMIFFEYIFQGIKTTPFMDILAKIGGAIGTLIFYPPYIFGKKKK